MRRIRFRSLVAGLAAAVSISGAAVAVTGGPAFAIAVPPCDDHAAYWNDVLLAAYRSVGGPPTVLSRAGAMMHLAMYDTAVSLGMTGTPYIAKVPRSAGFDYDTIANYDTAASTMLQNVFPGFNVSQYFTVARSGCPVVEPGPNGFSTDVAGKVVQNIMTARANDGLGNNTAYTPSITAGQWRPTDSSPAATPNWGLVKPFGLTSGSQFRPPLPGGFSTISAMLTSSAYATQVNEVKTAGSATATPAQRTADQTVAAYFWANDVNGTYKPPGQLYKMTQIVANARAGTNKIKLFALVSMAMADAAIAAWDAKYDTSIDLWRPETAIHEPQSDGNSATTPDGAWTPLSNDRNGVHFSPAFPAYVSGHATFAAAWAGVMKRFYATDAVTFTATTEDPHASGVTRTFTSFTAAANEDALSRLWLGVHYRWDADQGLATGDKVANYVFANYLR